MVLNYMIHTYRASDPAMPFVCGVSSTRSVSNMEELLRDGGEGPFVLGSEIGFRGFVIVSVLEELRRIGDELFERTVEGRKGLRCVSNC
jgi:hypothetical protein